MARRRMIDPEFFLDEELAKLSPHARLLYIGSWTIADDVSATFPNRPEWIKAQMFPYENIDIMAILKELIESGKFVAFEEENKKYFFIKNFHNFQRIEKPSQQKHPSFNDVSGSSRGVVALKLSKVKISKENIYTPDLNLTNDEHKNLVETYGVGITREFIDRLKDYKAQFPMKFSKYASHYATLRNWMRRDGVKKIAHKPQVLTEELKHDPRVAELIHKTAKELDK